MVKIVTSYVYKDLIEKVYDVFISQEAFLENYSDLLSEFILLKGENLGAVGTEFSFTWKNILKLKCKILENTNEPYFKYFKEKVVCNDPCDFTFYLTRFFYWNSVERTTYFVHEHYSEDPIFAKISDENTNSDEQIMILKRYENYLHKLNNNFNQTESILINKNINFVWDTITNWNLFTKVSPLIGQSVEYYGIPIEIGTKFKVSLESKNIVYYFKVANNISNEDSREFHLECYTRDLCKPIKLLIFKLKNIADKLTFLEVKDIFLNDVKYSTIHYVSKDKKIILAELKKYLNSG